MCSNHLAVGRQLQEQSHIGQASLALQLYLRGPVCSKSWKVQGCLCPLTITQTSSVSQNGSARSFGPSQNCFDTEVINVICLSLWTQAACKQVAKHQQDEFFPPPIPTPKPYETRQGQKSKQMFYICCAFWAQAVLGFFPFLLPWLCCCKDKHFFPYTSCLIAWHTTVWVSSVFSREIKEYGQCLLFLQKDLGGEEKLCGIRLMAYPAISTACVQGNSAVNRNKPKTQERQFITKGSLRHCLHSFSSPKCLRQLTSHLAYINDNNVFNKC